MPITTDHEKQTMYGHFLSFDNGKLTLRHTPDPHTEHTVEPDALVTLNGHQACMADLQPGDRVALIGEPAVSITAIR